MSQKYIDSRSCYIPILRESIAFFMIGLSLILLETVALIIRVEIIVSKRVDLFAFSVMRTGSKPF